MSTNSTRPSQQITLTAVSHIPLIQSGDALPDIILDALAQADMRLQDGDVLAIAQKIVSKSENRLVSLRTVQPSQRAVEVAQAVDKDPRLVELILQESEEISRMRPGVIIVRHRLGFTSANAGIDRSNVQGAEEEELALLLPEDPDQSAAQIRQAIADKTGVHVGVIITDSHGRPFRLGTVNIAIGVAGLPALWDRRGDTDMFGYTLKVTMIGLADEIAAAAGLIMGQADEAAPVVLVRGVTLPPGDGRATDLVRPKEMDLYR